MCLIIESACVKCSMCIIIESACVKCSMCIIIIPIMFLILLTTLIMVACYFIHFDTIIIVLELYCLYLQCIMYFNFCKMFRVQVPQNPEEPAKHTACRLHFG